MLLVRTAKSFNAEDAKIKQATWIGLLHHWSFCVTSDLSTFHAGACGSPKVIHSCTLGLAVQECHKDEN